MKKIFYVLIIAFSFFTGTAFSQCLVGSSYGSITSVACNVGFQVIEYDGYTEEYSTVGVTSGQTYTFRSSVTTDFITISNSAGATVYASGTGQVTWVATVTGNVRFYTHLDNACGTDDGDTERARMVACGPIAPPPANDECINAIDLSSGTLSGSNIGATQSQAGQVCAGYISPIADEVWYKFTTSASGNVSVTVTAGANSDLVLLGYSGTCGSLSFLACADATVAGAETLNLTGLAAGQTYYVRVFTYADSEPGSFTIAATGALPVTLSSFNGVRANNINKLTWSTATEINNAGFELQRSADGVNFSALTFVASKSATGNSNIATNYSFDDIRPLISTGYYRLKQIDKDGKATLSRIVEIKGNKVSALTVSAVYPNPVKNNLNVVVAAGTNEIVTLSVVDLAGKVISVKTQQAVLGDNTISINTANLANGTYLLKVTNAKGETAIQKFVKN